MKRSAEFKMSDPTQALKLAQMRCSVSSTRCEASKCASIIVGSGVMELARVNHALVVVVTSYS